MNGMETLALLAGTLVIGMVLTILYGIFTTLHERIRPMKQRVITFSGAEYTVTDMMHVQGGSKNLEHGILMNPPVQIDKSMIIYAPERVAVRDMPPPAPDAVPAVQSSDVISIEYTEPWVVRTLDKLWGILANAR